MDLSALTLVRATPDQRKKSIVNQFPAWGEPRGFTLDGFIAREHNLNGPGHKWTDGDNYVAFALVPRDDPQTNDILASCET